MANQAAKKTMKENARLLRNLRIQVAIFMGIYLLHFIWHFSSVRFWDWVGLAVFSAINFFVYLGLRAYARPTLNDEGEIVSPGSDLNQKGLIEYHWDLLYVTWFVQITSLYSKWFWLVMLVIPAFTVFKLWGTVIKPWLETESEETADPADKKRREKMEKKMNRTKYKVIRK
jgi:hypothetical protein